MTLAITDVLCPEGPFNGSIHKWQRGGYRWVLLRSPWSGCLGQWARRVARRLDARLPASPPRSRRLQQLRWRDALASMARHYPGLDGMAVVEGDECL